MSVYDVNGNEISSAGISSTDFELLAGNGDKATFVWEQGTLSTTNGANMTSTTRIRTHTYSRFDYSRYLFIHCPDGYKARAALYDATTSTPVFTSMKAYKEGNQLIKTGNEDIVYRFIFAKTDDSAITPSDLPNDFSIIPVYMPIWDAFANGKSVGPYVTARSNPDRVAEMLTVANTYWNNRNEYLNGQRVMVYGQSTIFDNDTYTNNIDCSAFVGLCLRGIPFNDTPYHTGVGKPMNDYPANPSYTWSINPFDYNLADEPTMRIRSASRLAKWMIAQRREIVLDPKLANVEVGDIVFYSRLDSNGVPYNPHRFLFMTHVALVISKRLVTEYSASATYALNDLVQYSGALYECKTAISTAEAWNPSHWTKIYNTWDISVVPYYHEVMESTTVTPTINKKTLEKNWETPTDFTTPNFNSLSLVCRPDLGGL